MLIIRTRLFYFAFLKDPAGAALEKAAQTFGSKPTKKIVPGGGASEPPLKWRLRLRNTDPKSSDFSSQLRLFLLLKKYLSLHILD